MSGESATTTGLYRIGAVSRLTGVETVTLRMWERRYTLVCPQRSEAGTRLYSREDIERLALIKQLVDQGNSIGTIACLSLEQLQKRLRGESPLPGHRNARERTAIAVLGDALPTLLAQHKRELPGIELAVVESEQGKFRQRVGLLRPQVIVFEYPTLHEEAENDVVTIARDCGAETVVVVYGFGRRDINQRLDRRGIVLLRAPIGMVEFRHACLRRSSTSAAEPVWRIAAAGRREKPVAMPRRFSDAEMIGLAHASIAIHCECPRHLVDLVLSLSAFERYSAECRDRSPTDASLHAYLQRSAAQARSLIEEALEKVVEAEGLARILRGGRE